MLIELLVKPNGAKVDPPRRFPDCASEMTGASLSASLNMVSLDF